MIRALCLASCALAAGCPVPLEPGETEPDPDCLQYQSLDLPEPQDTVAAWELEVGEVERQAQIDLFVELRNTLEQDCPVAVYAGREAPDLAQAPALDAETVPPGEVDGLGRLVYDRIVPRSFDGQLSFVQAMFDLDLRPRESLFVTLISCEGIDMYGHVNLREVCREDVDLQVFP